MKFLKKIAHNIRVHGHTTWLCARDPELGWPLRVFALVIAGYALSPVDLIPDFIPVIGFLDDAVLIPLGIWLFRKWVPTDVYARNLGIAEAASSRPVSKVAAIAIVALWIGTALWLGRATGLV
jgi:uncharacterized membrane protein YkvA (DUF1232 family)